MWQCDKQEVEIIKRGARREVSEDIVWRQDGRAQARCATTLLSSNSSTCRDVSIVQI